MASETSTPQRYIPLKAWDRFGVIILNLFVLFIVVIYLFPMAYMFVTSIKHTEQFADPKAPVIWPGKAVTMTYNGEEIDVFEAPEAGYGDEWGLITKGRFESEFINAQRPEDPPFMWEGSWRTLQPVYVPSLSFDSFNTLWERVDFTSLLYNSAVVVILSSIGVILASILVAYGFARFPIPGGNFLFLVLIATIIIPEKVTLIPTYFAFIHYLDWGGTWYPLIVPFWFGNAILIFLLRQNFKSIPIDMEEAAMLDGAGPLRILTAIMIPQAVPTIVTMILLHFFYIWNEFRISALYLSTESDLYTVSYGLLQYQSFFRQPNTVQASSLVSMLIPFIILLLAQRVFMQGVRVTGLEK